MDHEFWKSAWDEGRTNFHKADFHDKLVHFFPALNCPHGSTVLVPLCGKSRDMIWLADQGFRVIGVELVEQAALQFFEENQLTHTVREKSPFKIYRSGLIEIWCGDFFQFEPAHPIEVIYDRAAIVALPSALRQQYASKLTAISPSSTEILMLTFAYDSTDSNGPPFSVTPNEIQSLFGDSFEIRTLENAPLSNEHPRLLAIPNITQPVTQLRKI